MCPESAEPSTLTFHSLAALHAFIERHQAWGMQLDEFKRTAASRQTREFTHATRFFWGPSETELEDVWALVQYIHRAYLSDAL